MDISLIIPTKNRHNFVKKIVLFYVNTDFTGQILFADSSDKSDFIKNSTLIGKFKKNLDIVQINTFGKKVAESILATKIFVKNNYCVQSGDDDFFYTPTLIKCINFLKMKDDFFSCHGRGYTSIKKTGNLKFGFYGLGSIHDASAKKRIKKYINNRMCLAWVVMRKSDFFDCWNNPSLFHNNILGSDFLVATKICIGGKVGYINLPYMVHHVDETNHSSSKPLSKRIEEQFLHVALHKDLDNSKKLIKSFVRKHKRSYKEDEFTDYFLFLLSNKIENTLFKNLNIISLNFIIISLRFKLLSLRRKFTGYKDLLFLNEVKKIIGE